MQKNLLKKAKRWSAFLVFLPGIKAIFLSGSVSQGKGKSTSDIDFFIITKAGQIFTACFFVKLVLKVSFQLAFDAKNHAGKICPNHFITTQNLEIQEKDKYSAHLFSHNQFLAGDKALWNDFVLANKEWIKEFNESFKNPLFDRETKNHKNKSTSFLIQKLETILKKIQIKKIERNQKNLPLQAKVILDDLEIRFHPLPKNRHLPKKPAPLVDFLEPQTNQQHKENIR